MRISDWSSDVCSSDLEGVARFRVHRELDVTTPFRQVEAEIEREVEGAAGLASIERASLEREAKRFAARQGYVVDWDSVAQLDDETLVNGIAQVAPRSEEHTSELQSLMRISYAVFCLKKKKIHNTTNKKTYIRRSMQQT